MPGNICRKHPLDGYSANKPYRLLVIASVELGEPAEGGQLVHLQKFKERELEVSIINQILLHRPILSLT